MTIEEFLLALLTVDAPAAITGTLNGRIRFGVIEKGCSYPVARVTGISNPTAERTSKGKQHTTKRSLFQIDVFDKTYLDTQQLAQKLGDHLDGYQGVKTDASERLIIQLIEVENIKPGYGNATETHQHSLDLAILYRRETL